MVDIGGTMNRGSYFVGFLLIGLGLLFIIPQLRVFPFILLIIAFCFVPDMFRKGKFKNGLQNFIWLAGLFIIFQFKIYLPAILILVGVQMLLSAVLDTKIRRRT